MSNHQASYILRNVLKLMLRKDFFNNKTDEEKQDFLHGIMEICGGYDGNEGEVVEDIADKLSYCYWCEKVVPIRKGELLCSKCNLEESKKKLGYFERTYNSLDYFDGKDELTKRERLDKEEWLELLADIEELKKLVKEDFGE